MLLKLTLQTIICRQQSLQKKSLMESQQDQQLKELPLANEDQQKQEQLNGDIISKKKQKKIEKKQKWQQLKKEKRIQKRQQQKLKKKLKKQTLKESQQPLQSHKQKHSLQQCQELEDSPQKKLVLQAKRKEDYIQKMNGGLKVIIDLQFYDLMTEKQQCSLIKQLSYCHSVNRKAKKPFNFILTSASVHQKKDLQEKYNAYNWGITIQMENLMETIPHQRLVYLTGDAREQIENLDEKDVYIIGGIVDHNRLKSITYDYAEQKGIRSRRLPMEGVQLKASVHLAVNHVWEWILKVYNGETWGSAIKQVIPSRKIKQQ